MDGDFFYHAEERDYEAVRKSYYVEQTLLHIRNNLNLDDERVLCYAQPIFCVEDSRFRTAESLMRLRIDGEMVFPDQFIPLAEENNCIHALTCIMLHKVCKQVKKMQDTYEFDGITLNCSSTEFSDPNLYKELLEIIKNNEVDPKYIRIELTESAVFSNMKAVMENMDQLKKAGIRFYMDDFGTGYSNIEKILSLPFHTIKFDKSLLYKSIENKKVEKMLSHMVTAFKQIGFQILVEGVEDEDQTSFSIDHGFEFLQGYHYSKPKPIEELENYFSLKDETQRYDSLHEGT